ncbi:MAG: choice-of-anchor tandem repeat GloVer-containing protein [Candidatus Tumulicola sp.]
MRIGYAILVMAAFTACSQAGGSSTVPLHQSGDVLGAMSLHAGYRYLYSFKGGPNDGKWPTSALIELDGTIYGAALGAGPEDDGLIFAIDAAGKERVVYAFKGHASDGSQPGALTSLNGVLYGVTMGGGSARDGIVFSLSPSGSERVLHSFGGTGDGRQPTNIVALNGQLFGVTLTGGAFNGGTVFEISPSGAEHVLYSFKGGSDGRIPSGLTVSGATLYGTTTLGGGDGCYRAGCGTLFRISPGGTESVVYSFKGGAQGEYPSKPLLFARGTFFGVTSLGGAYGFGSVFAVSSDGLGRTFYSFKNAGDGNDPTAICELGDTLYATSGFGNASYVGALIALDALGNETTIHQFADDRRDGAVPAALTVRDGVLYGTTAYGGSKNRGTLFGVRP